MPDLIECPDCGSKLVTITQGGHRWGVFSQTYQCNHCKRSFTRRQRRRRASVDDGGAPDDLNRVAVYNPKAVKCRCPACDAPNPRVTSTGKNGIRSHRCTCGHCFKSMESENGTQ